MGRKAGSMVRCTCTRCGEIELRAGCSCDFICTSCRPRTLQELAHSAVGRAVRRGELRRPSEFPCKDCGKPASQYDHRDYTKPLEVEPVCRSCNVKRGRAFDSVYRPQSESFHAESFPAPSFSVLSQESDTNP